MSIRTLSSLAWRCAGDGWRIVREHNLTAGERHPLGELLDRIADGGERPPPADPAARPRRSRSMGKPPRVGSTR